MNVVCLDPKGILPAPSLQFPRPPVLPLVCFSGSSVLNNPKIGCPPIARFVLKACPPVQVGDFFMTHPCFVCWVPPVPWYWAEREGVPAVLRHPSGLAAGGLGDLLLGFDP